MSDASVIDHRWIERTIQLATQNVAHGGGPFGALIVRDDSLLAEGQNRVTATASAPFDAWLAHDHRTDY